MGQGIATVVSASKRGGFRISKDAHHIAGLLSTSLDSGDSANPFQDVGLGEWMIFELLDETTFTPVADRIKEIFDDFEEQELAALQKRSDNLKVFQTNEGEAAMAVHAVDLETADNFTLAVVGSSKGLTVSLIG